MKIAYDPIYAHPLPEGHRFPMLKYELIPQQLLREGLIDQENIFSPDKLDEETILLTHEKDYWERLRDLVLSPKEIRRTGFPLTAELVEREIRIAKGTIDGCHYAFQNGVAFNVAGGTHHAGTNWGEGFCLLNDQAIAANYLLDKKLASHILIIDLDVHQGNGTAQIFKSNNQVFTFSMHGEKNFPFNKEASALDIGLPDGCEDEVYLDLLTKNLSAIVNTQNPNFVFYLSGVDILESDKLGKLSITKSGCKMRDFVVLNTCKQLNIPVQVSMGGGYSPLIGDIVDAHCNTFKTAIDLYF